MIKILIVDDSPRKTQKLFELISSIPEYKNMSDCDAVANLVSARNKLENNKYDLLILDLMLPNRSGDEPQVDSGVKFLDEIHRGLRLIKPASIIGLSAYDNLISDYGEKFASQSWSLVTYSENENRWSIQIKNKIEYLINSKREFHYNSVTSQFDLAIITALSQTELEAVLLLNANWESFHVPTDATEYHKGMFIRGDIKVSVVAACAPQMGMTASAVLTTKMIQHFRPKYIAMTGIAAALPGKANYGDVLIADLSFDSGSGKILTDVKTKKSKFEPDYRVINLSVDLKEIITSCIRKRSYLEAIELAWEGEKPTSPLAALLGPLGSGSGVIENEQFVEEIRGHSRKLLGVDMETYGVFYASANCSKPRPIAVLSFKSVSDFANPDKNDLYQKYAAYTSATYLYEFALDKLPLDTF